MKNALLIFRKEIRDNARDRRSLGISLLTALGIPIFIIFVLAFVKQDQEQKLEADLKVNAVGLEHAAPVAAFLRDHGIFLEEAPQGRSAEDLAREKGLALNIPEEASDRFMGGESVILQVYVDGARMDNRLAAKRLSRGLQLFGSAVLAARLGNQGVSAATLGSWQVIDEDVSQQSESYLSMILSMLPIIMIASALSGGHYLAVDITAGEVERRSAEPLLQLPVGVASILVGKLAAVLAFCVLSTALSGATFLMMTQLDVIKNLTQINMVLEIPVFMQSFSLLLPFCVLVAALEMLIGLFAKSVKEAQTYIQILIALGSMPPYLMAVMDMKEKAWSIFLPALSQYFLIGRLQRGETVSWHEAMIATASTLLLALMAVIASHRLYFREHIAKQ